jgi:hypothetical protein
MIQHLRNVLSWPLVTVQFLAVVVFYSFGVFARLLVRLHAGSLPHIYVPIIRAKRWVRGEPSWQVQDCLHLGLQPRTEEERARADADERLLKLSCVCGLPECTTEGLYIARSTTD